MPKHTSEHKFNYDLFDYSPVGMCVIDKDLRIVHWNSCLEDWTRMNRTEILGTDLRDFCPRFREEYYRKRIESVFSSGAPVIFSPQLHQGLFPIRLYDGTFQIQQIKLTTLPPTPSGKPHALFSIEDATELFRKIHDYRHEHETARSEIRLRIEAEEELRRSLEMKDFLIREIHHRVKNNLSMVASLIGLQDQNLYDQRDRSVLEELRGKIRSISLVHEKLYAGTDLKTINIHEYLTDLLPVLCNTSLPPDRGIWITSNIAPVDVSLDTAIPIALIVTELFINSVKYAFPQNRKGTIAVFFTHTDNSHFTLSVKDDGIGLPEDFDFTKTEALGSKLILTFARQLNGTVQIIPGPGTEIHITFPKNSILPPIPPS